MVFAKSPETLEAAIIRVDTAEENFLIAQQNVQNIVDMYGQVPRQIQINHLTARIAAHLQIIQSALIYRQSMRDKGMLLIQQLRTNQQLHANINGRSAADFAEQVFRTPLDRIDEIDAMLDAAFVGDDAGIKTRLVHIRGLRHAELTATNLANRQLERIRVLGGFLDVEIDRQLAYWQRYVDNEYDVVNASLNLNRLYLILACAASVIGAFGIGWFYLGRSIVQRLERIDTSMRAVSNREYDTPIPDSGSDEIARMGASLAIFRDAMERVDYLAHHDALTGFLNRHGFSIKGQNLIDNHDNGCLIYLNLQAFKEVNDTFGHEVGDRILVATSDCIAQVTLPNAVLARLGGDDFAMLIPEITLSDALKHARTIQSALRQITVDGATVSDLYAAFGIAEFPLHGSSTKSLMQRADMAMNVARTAHIATIRTYEESLGQAAEYRKILRSELHQALKDNQFFLHYQPQIDIMKRCIVGAEALIRWAHPTRGLISPADFIPIAERSGFIRELGHWVLHESCHQLKKWQDKGLQINMAVNVSALQILDPKVVQHVEEALTSSGVSPHQLEIEITESIFLREEEGVMDRLQELRDAGLEMALDDFGTGYSSLSYLKRLPVSTLKIDQSFVREMFVGNDDTRITSAIIQMAHSLNLKVVAEGIESERQLEFFKNAGCDIGQGFLFSRPLGADDFEAFYAMNNCHKGA